MVRLYNLWYIFFQWYTKMQLFVQSWLKKESLKKISQLKSWEMLKILLLLSNSIVIHPLWIIYSNIVLCSPNLQEQCFPSPSTSLPIELADREMHFSLSLSTLFFIYHFSQLCCGKEISTSLLMSLCFFLLGKKISKEDSKYYQIHWKI